VTAGETVVRISGFPALLLAILAIHEGRRLTTDQLIEFAWAGHPPATAPAALRVHLAKLRQALGNADALPFGHYGYALDRSLVTTDLDELAAVVAALGDPGRAGEPRQRLVLVERALSLWRGTPFADVQDVPEVHAEAQRLAELRLDLEEVRADTLITLGRHEEACRDLAVMASASPLREFRTRLLMLAQYRCGRQGDALATSRALRDRLGAEMGIDPSEETRRLELRILRQDPDLMPPPAPASAPALTDRGRPRSVSAVPRTTDMLVSVVSGRLAALDGAASRLVDLVAVLDDGAHPPVLRTALGLDAVELAAAVSRAAASGLVVDRAEDGHPVSMPNRDLRDAVLHRLSVVELRALHHEAGEALVAQRSSSALVLGAWHMLASGHDPDAAARACLQAIDACIRAGIPQTGDELCLEALRVAPASGPLVADLLTRRVRTLSMLGRSAEVEDAWRAAIDAAREADDPERFALAVMVREWDLRSFHVVDEETPRLLREALRALGPGRTALRVRVESALLFDTMLAGRSMEERAAVVDAVRVAAEATGDPIALATACRARHTLLRGSPDVTARADAARDFVAAADSTGDAWWRAVAEFGRLYDEFVVGGHARIDLKDMVGHTGHSASGRLNWHHALTRASLARDLGDFAGAARWADQALMTGAEAGVVDAPGAYALHQFLVAFQRGPVGPMVDMLRTEAARGVQHAMAMGIVAIAEAQAGEVDAARANIERSLGRVPDDPLESAPITLCCLTEAVTALGGADVVPELRAALDPYAGQFAVYGQVTATLGPIDRCRGLLAALDGSPEEALVLLGAAERAAAAAGAVPWEVRSAADRVGVLLSLGRRTDAAALAARHVEAARRLGLGPPLARFSEAAS
jgi:DNA-binding SARP family transcriptional activator